MRDLRRLADQLGRKGLELALDRLGDRLLGGELVVGLRVAAATDDEAIVVGLLPVIEAVPGVVRAVEEAARQRLGGDHLAAYGNDDFVQAR